MPPGPQLQPGHRKLESPLCWCVRAGRQPLQAWASLPSSGRSGSRYPRCLRQRSSCSAVRHPCPHASLRGARLHPTAGQDGGLDQRPQEPERQPAASSGVKCAPTLLESGLGLCGHGAFNPGPYLTRYLLMLTKCRVSVSQVVVQGTRPSNPSPMSHLLVSAAISRGTCSLVHLSTQAWNL